MAKIQLSSGHNEGRGAGGPGIYQNINRRSEADEEGGAGMTITPEEWALVKDPGLIFMKNAIIGKAVALFAGLTAEMTARWELQRWPPPLTEWVPAIGRMGPKISRGENYQGLPWVVMDHPRLFGKTDVFAVRTLFWWGHYFSVTLHLKGVYKERWLTVIQGNIPLLAGAGYHVCISQDEWRHELAADNYCPLTGTSPEKIAAICEEAAFLKFSAVVPLAEWNVAHEQILRLYEVLLQSLTTHY
ncbi:MAG: hypothetical protein P4L51_27145 [Puia sp.]|nr:hypothetical protein [Puia sp.]